MAERLTIIFSDRNGASGLPCGWHGQRKVLPWNDAHPQPKRGETWLVEVITEWDAGVLSVKRNGNATPELRYGACLYVRPVKLVRKANA